MKFDQKIDIEIKRHTADIGFNFDPETFDFLLSEGKLLLILDGFDEIPDKKRKKVALELESIATKYTKSRILVSSRPNAGINNSWKFRNYKIDDLHINDQLKFVKHVFKAQESCDDILRLLKTENLISKVTITPLLLTLFMITYHVRRFQPDSIIEFYSMIFPTMLYRHDRMKLGFNRERLSKLTDYQFQRCFESLSFISLKENKARFNRRTFLNYVQTVIRSENFVKDIEDKIVDDLMNITSLIVSDGFDEYSYVHKSIQEYFAATYLKEIEINKREIFYSRVSKNIDTFRHWENVLNFLKIIDNYAYTKYFFYSYRKKFLGIKSKNNVVLNKRRFNELISPETTALVTEEGEILEIKWGGSIFATIEPKYAQLIRNDIEHRLEKYEKEFALFLALCDLDKYEKYQESEEFIVPLLEVLSTNMDILDEIRENVASNIKNSPYVRDVLNEETRIAKSDNLKDLILNL